MTGKSCSQRLLWLPLLIMPVSASADRYVEKFGDLRLDEVQYIATHNSYHVAPKPAINAIIEQSEGQRDGVWTGPKLARSLAYTHPPLTVQLDRGLRAFELDIHDDPQGARFARPGIAKALLARGLASQRAEDHIGVMSEPGFKVFHHTDYDQGSTCKTLKTCLSELAAWSARNPRHAPIVVFLETKQKSAWPLTDDYTAAPHARFTPASWSRLHTEIEAVFTPDQVIVPTEVQGSYVSLEEALQHRGWLTLNQLAGRFLFFLLDSEQAMLDYRAGIGTAKPILFTGDRPETGGAYQKLSAPWITLPSPTDARISTAISRRRLAFTRADAETEEARSGSVKRRDQAFASGAHIISTDYPAPDPLLSSYAVRFNATGFIRCNPVTARACGTARSRRR